MFQRDGGVQMRSARFLLPRRPYTLADMEVRLAMKSASRSSLVSFGNTTSTRLPCSSSSVTMQLNPKRVNRSLCSTLLRQAYRFHVSISR